MIPIWFTQALRLVLLIWSDDQRIFFVVNGVRDSYSVSVIYR